LVARLKDGATEQQARAELQTIGSDLERAFPLANKGRSFTTLPLLESTINPGQRGLFQSAGALMMLVVGIVLLIACFNIANLLLAGPREENGRFLFVLPLALRAAGSWCNC